MLWLQLVIRVYTAFPPKVIIQWSEISELGPTHILGDEATAVRFGETQNLK